MLVIWALQALSYYGIIRKMGFEQGFAFVPIAAESISSYSPTYKQLDAMELEAEKSMCDDYFSIMASQQAKARDNDSFLSEFATDYTQEPWYVKGFEDYDTADAFIDIPLKDTGAGYQIELPDKVWKAVVDCQVAAYMRTKDGRMYLGSDHVGALDENGNPMVALENSWPHIGGALICYNAAQARDTEEGTVFSGTTTALLNGKTQIKIFIECDLQFGGMLTDIYQRTFLTETLETHVEQ